MDINEQKIWRVQAENNQNMVRLFVFATDCSYTELAKCERHVKGN